MLRISITCSYLTFQENPEILGTNKVIIWSQENSVKKKESKGFKYNFYS